MKTTTELLPHQINAVDKLLPTRIGALFAEMGTGKSRMAIELVARRQHKLDRVLWFCPVSLKETIRAEILKHTDCTVQDIYLFDEKTTDKNIPTCFWYILGIESMSASARVTVAAHALITETSMVIVDESSYIKGHDALRSLRITHLAEVARYRLILTGTPISQGVVDLYAQMCFLSPDILGYRSFYSFAHNHLEYSDTHPGLIVRSHNIPYLTAKIEPYVYQVTKAECLDLPKKLYEERTFCMSDEQAEWYQQAKNELFAEMQEANTYMERMALLRLFTALQQITCGFWRRHRKGYPVQRIEIPHYRLNTLLYVLQGIPEQEKVILWTKYQHDITDISSALTGRYGASSVAHFHGGLSERQRNEHLQAFRADARFLLATPTCGGHGLTLNEAHTVIYYNNSFKYADRQQSEDRCHRYGQEYPVTYIDIVCSSSIDERIARAIALKADAVQVFQREVQKVKDKERIKQMIDTL